MVAIETFSQMALSFPEATQQPHFEKPSFRVAKKIFATIDLKAGRACVKLSVKDQDIFGLADRSVIFPVPNKWGQQGWTFIDLQKVSPELCGEALKTAYCEVAPKKLADKLFRAGND